MVITQFLPHQNYVHYNTLCSLHFLQAYRQILPELFQQFLGQQVQAIMQKHKFIEFGVKRLYLNSYKIAISNRRQIFFVHVCAMSLLPSMYLSSQSFVTVWVICLNA